MLILAFLSHEFHEANFSGRPVQEPQKALPSLYKTCALPETVESAETTETLPGTSFFQVRQCWSRLHCGLAGRDFDFIAQFSDSMSSELCFAENLCFPVLS